MSLYACEDPNSVQEAGETPSDGSTTTHDGSTSDGDDRADDGSGGGAATEDDSGNPDGGDDTGGDDGTTTGDPDTGSGGSETSDAGDADTDETGEAGETSDDRGDGSGDTGDDGEEGGEDSGGTGDDGEDSGGDSGDAGDDGGDTGDDPPPDPVGPNPVVVYWGQNGWGGAHQDQPEQWEASLADTCRDGDAYDVVVLAFVISFIDTRNENELPGMNFSFHCTESYDAANPFLLRCPEIEEGIKECHRLGKTVLLSLGGATGSYGFSSDEQARQFARTTWDMFMGGTHEYRPFGTAIVDGIDLDIEGGSSTGYTAYVQDLRQIIDVERDGRNYYIAAAPQCVYPDAYLGSTFEAAGSHFDFLFVQFYNNWCRYGMNTGFNFQEWSALYDGGAGPRIVVGLPATEEAAGSGYVPPDELDGLADMTVDEPAFGGFMVWDASFDQNSDVSGERYSAHLRDLL